MTPKQVEKHYGSRPAICEKFGWSRQRVHHWFVNASIPNDAQKLIEADTNGKLKAVKK